MVIRWIGAFGKGESLFQSLSWEFTQEREVAAERVTGGKGTIEHAQIGLRVASEAVIRHYEGDVWSKVSPDGRLYATRRACRGHSECFCKPVYTGIVCKQHPSRLAKLVQEAVFQASEKFGVSVFYVTEKGEVKKVK